MYNQPSSSSLRCSTHSRSGLCDRLEFLPTNLDESCLHEPHCLHLDMLEQTRPSFVVNTNCNALQRSSRQFGGSGSSLRWSGVRILLGRESVNLLVKLVKFFDWSLTDACKQIITIKCIIVSSSCGASEWNVLFLFKAGVVLKSADREG